MPQTPRKRNLPGPNPPPRPGMDVIVTKKQASQFPGVGMTLNSYNQNSAKRARVSPSADPRKLPLRKRIFKKRTLKRLIITLLILGLLGGLFYGGKLLYNLHKAFGGNIFDLLHTSKLKGEDTGRVNILLAGNSPDDPMHGGANLTDSIMILSIDTRHNTAWMLSVPRDLWVNIPNHGYQKINAAYEDGKADNFSANGYPSGGMGDLEQIVSQKFAIPINYYALINYTAFKQAVDAVGGITINIQSPDRRGLYDAYTNLKLPNGNVTLNGQQALNLARARGDGAAGDISYGFLHSDFDRTLHQRQMLVALQSKASSSSVLANPIKLSSLFDSLGNNVQTDLKLSDARRLYDLSKKIPSQKIQSLSLSDANGHNLLTGYNSRDGQAALIPALGINNYSDIAAFVAQHISNNPIVQEGAKVVVLNATNVSGLATKYQQSLTISHINVSQTGNYFGGISAVSSIIDTSNGSKPATRAALIQQFGNNVAKSNPYIGNYSADFIVIVGNDKSSGI